MKIYSSLGSLILIVFFLSCAVLCFIAFCKFANKQMHKNLVNRYDKVKAEGYKAGLNNTKIVHQKNYGFQELYYEHYRKGLQERNDNILKQKTNGLSNS